MTPIRVVLADTQGVATDGAPTAPAMPGFEWLLNERQVAVVLTHVRNSWCNAAPMVTAADAAKSRSALAKGDE
jgi:hypothetical protein